MVIRDSSENEGGKGVARIGSGGDNGDEDESIWRLT